MHRACACDDRVRVRVRVHVRSSMHFDSMSILLTPAASCTQKASAFNDFAGKVLFINNPFPSLRGILPFAFAKMSHAESRVELIDQQVLASIGRGVRCSFFDSVLHSRMLLDHTIQLLGLKRAYVWF
jgi:hypothetical protein